MLRQWERTQTCCCSETLPGDFLIRQVWAAFPLPKNAVGTSIWTTPYFLKESFNIILTAPWYISTSLSPKYGICLKGLTDMSTGPMYVCVYRSRVKSPLIIHIIYISIHCITQRISHCFKKKNSNLRFIPTHRTYHKHSMQVWSFCWASTNYVLFLLSNRPALLFQLCDVLLSSFIHYNVIN